MPRRKAVIEETDNGERRDTTDAKHHLASVEELESGEDERRDTFTIKYRPGDLFEDAPPGTMYVHSCNCEGVWGAGVAKDFKKLFPGAFDVYERYSKGSTGLPEPPLGSALILLPPDMDDSEVARPAADQVYIACLFVKSRRGAPKRKAEIERIKADTRAAMQQLVQGIEALAAREPWFRIKEIRMPKINAGIFKVPWRETAKIVEETLRPVSERFQDLETIFVYTG